MALTIYCGTCGTRFQTGEQNAGKIGKCGSCKTRFPIQSSNLDKPQIRLFCPTCHDKLRAWPEQGGEQMHCRKCQQQIRLPLLEEELEDIVDAPETAQAQTAELAQVVPGADSFDPSLAEQTTDLSAFFAEEGQAEATAAGAKAEASRLEGVELAGQGRHAEALECYDRAIASAPDDVQVWHDKAASLMDLGRNDEALTCLDQALGIHPGYTMALVSRGLCLSALGRLEEAVQAYDAALATNPDYAVALYNKGVALWELGKEAEGRECLKQAGSLDANIAEELKKQGLM